MLDSNRETQRGLDVDSFSCGEQVIDTWFHRDALEYQEEGSCTVYVAVNDNNVIVFGLRRPRPLGRGGSKPSSFHRNR